MKAYAHMERMGGNFEAAKTILEAAISVESRNPATLMVCASESASYMLLIVIMALFFLML
jgi:hypothetical protein